MAASTVSEDDPRLVFVPIDEAAVPPGGIIDHMKDRWWFVHPTKGLVFWRSSPRSDHLSPQCNGDEKVMRHISETYPWAEIRFIPSVFRRVRIRDYA